MKNYSIFLSLVAVFFVLGLNAEAARFETPLGPGANNPKAEVIKLQQFLFEKGYLRVAPTGNYLSLTVQAVKDFQLSQGIETVGFFGPLTRAAANRIYESRVAAEVGDFSVSNSTNTAGVASVFLSQTKEIKWETKNYPANIGVNINLLRKVSDNPVEYELVRQIAKDTANDGLETWLPLSSDGDKSNLYIEVTCSTTHDFGGECRFSGKTVKAF